jgi:hypothetical protein
MNNIYKKMSGLLLALFLISMSSGCSVQLIAEQDEVSLQQMEMLAQEVDHFFTQLLYLPAEKRLYQSSKQGYLAIEVKLNALKMRQEVRSMNELTLKQVDIAIKLWTQDRTRHQTQDQFSNFLIKRYRSQYKRLFLAMIKGEEVKEKQNV